MNLDALVSVGLPPWSPGRAVHDVDAWDKYDIPTCGTFRSAGRLVVFTLITTGGSRSLWAYVPVPEDDEQAISEAYFDTEAEFDAFLSGCFADREVVFAAAENFVITSKSGGMHVPAGKHQLLAVGAAWYAQQLSVQARSGHAPSARADEPNAVLLAAAQGILAGNRA